EQQQQQAKATDRRDYLILGKRAGEQSYRNERNRQERQSEIAREHYADLRIAEGHENQRKHPGQPYHNQHKSRRRYELSRDDLAGPDWSRQQKLVRAGSLLFGKASH